MIESPVLQELKAEWTREAAREARVQDLLTILTSRFGAEAEGLADALRALRDDALLNEFVRFALRCPDLNAFRDRLAP